MRYLNKLVLINSASAKYAEVKIDGNVHFIGTQGVGKSTVLRAILFFYNANTLKLGISKEKQTFADYYLPFADSYIVYEIVRESGSFCVMLQKSQGRVCFRFLDTEYRKEFFIAPEGYAHDHWERVRILLDEQKIPYSRKIMKYEEYRDIIYGNLPPRSEFGKYTLTESKQFQNIPRTIQNVFLNSKLEAGFIKETIIDSLNDEDIHINLQTYQYELKGFEDELSDLEQFKKPRILKQADEINAAHIKFKHSKREKLRLASELGSAFAQSTEKLPNLEDRLKAYDRDVEKINKRIQSLDSAFDHKKTKITGEIASHKTQLDTAKIRWESYQQMGIQSILDRVGKKKDLEQERANLLKEKDLLGTKYKEITQRFDALISELRNQQSSFENNKQSELLAEKEQLMADSERLRQDYEAQVGQLVQQTEQKRKDAEEELQDQQQAQSRLKVRRAEIKHRRYYEEELDRIQDSIRQHKQSVQDANNKIQLAKGLQESFQKKWVSEVDSVKHRVDYQIKSEQVEIETLLGKIAAINQKIENSKNSLYAWLNKELKGWEKNIGQIIDEEVLFRNDLSPEKDEEKSKSLYGVKLRLKEIHKPVKTVDDYRNDIAILDAKISEHKKSIQKAQDELEEETDKIKRRNNQRVKQLSDELREQEYTLVEAERKLQSAELQQEDLQGKADREKTEALNEIDEELAQSIAATEAAQKELQKINGSVQRRKKQRLDELSEKLSAIKTQQTKRIDAIKIEIDTYKAKIKEREKKLIAEQSGELEKEGAETLRLEEITSRLGAIKSELKFIENNRDKVSDFKKDKRELFDKEQGLQSTKRLHEQQLKQEEQKYTTQRAQLEKETDRLSRECAAVEKDLDQIKAELDEMELFKQSGWYADIETIVNAADPNLRTSADCRQLINQLRETHYTIIDVTNQLSEQVTKFLSHFSEQNVFNFNTKIGSPAEFIAFAEDLSDFIEDNRIAEYEKRVNERYAEIIRLIGSETSDLTSKQGEILRVVTKINQDFTEKNFAGVIKKIELRLSDTNNKVVQVLKLIKNFNDTHQVELGAPNLFSQQNNNKQNKKAVELLKQLVIEIRRQKNEFISLADSFELQFRVIENDNDTGWVERLANVGSEGTDVLVKAMVNIMLLNVFKEGASKRFKAFKLHCMMDEIGRLHPANIRGILQFANDRNIMLINGSPTEHDAMAYKHIYKLEKDVDSVTKVKRILSQG